jgi:tRNA A64-2'-O-ribosylphosphate transferase
LTIPALPRPLRPIFIHPGTSYPPTLPLPSASTSSTSPPTPPFIPIICLSASTFIPHGGPEPKRDVYGTFEYVQGSGDDDELWGKGLKPGHFFRNREEILSASREELPELIARLVERGQNQAGSASVTQGLGVWKEIPRGSKIWLGTTASDLPKDLGSCALITFEHSDKPSIETVSSDEASTSKQLVLRLQEGKKKKIDLDYATQVLPAVVEFARRVRSQDLNTYILIRDPTGKSLSVGAAICLSWLFVQSDRSLRPISNAEEDGAVQPPSLPVPTKEDLRKRLEWILDERQGVNPSRHVLKAVNEYLISAKYK